MKPLTNAIRMAFLFFQIRALQATIDGADTCLELVSDPFYNNRILIAQTNARRELRCVIGEFNAIRNSFRRRSSWRAA